MKRIAISLLAFVLLAACTPAPKQPVADPSEAPVSVDPLPSEDPSSAPPASSDPSPDPPVSADPSAETPESADPSADVPAGWQFTSARATDCSFVLTYEVPAGMKSGTFGICWNRDGDPTLEDDFIYGPKGGDGQIFQVLPNSLFEEGGTYVLKAFRMEGEETLYSEAVTLQLGYSPGPMDLEWTRLQRDVLPEGIELYATTSPVSGRPFHAWYAIADLSRVDFRVNAPDGASTIEAQSQADPNCVVLVNGGYFYAGAIAGLAYVAGRSYGAVNQSRGSLRSADPDYKEMYFVTRGIFGVDKQGTPAANWVGSRYEKHLFYDCPLPSVRGESKYGAISATYARPVIDWAPEYAVSAGPVLLKDGKIPFSFEQTEKGGEYWLNNYELMPYDIFGPDVICDRTAVGCLPDGRVLLFICDGRISDSPGLNLMELARILKGLGCKDALNLDGGGSTGMMVGTEHIGDQTAEKSRAVVTTAGFYKR